LKSKQKETILMTEIKKYGQPTQPTPPAESKPAGFPIGDAPPEDEIKLADAEDHIQAAIRILSAQGDDSAVLAVGKLKGALEKLK
jgi:hypothetical protein